MFLAVVFTWSHCCKETSLLKPSFSAIPLELAILIKLCGTTGMHGGWDDVVTLIRKDWDTLVRPTLCRRGNARLVGGFLCLLLHSFSAVFVIKQFG